MLLTGATVCSAHHVAALVDALGSALAVARERAKIAHRRAVVDERPGAKLQVSRIFIVVAQERGAAHDLSGSVDIGGVAAVARAVTHQKAPSFTVPEPG